METKTSSTGIPYIEIDEWNRLAFSKITSDEESYRYLIFTGRYEINGKKGKRILRNGFITNMNFSNFTSDTRGLDVDLKKKLKKVRTIVKKYIDKDGNFPKEKLLSFSKKINPKSFLSN